MTHPMQPIIVADDGVIRFKPNKIVELLLEDSTERGRIDMNTIAVWLGERRVSVEDMVQFAQLLGYSVSGMGDLDYVPHDILVVIDEEADKVWRNRKGD
jgi:hypothetical protein